MICGCATGSRPAASTRQATSTLIVVPPPQMVANMKVGNMDAFCVGEPWNEQLVHQGIGFTALTTGELWFRHPEKILGMRAAFVDANPKATLAIMMAVMEAQQWCDKMENKQEMAEIVGKRQWYNVPVADIIGRIKGDINYGNGRDRHRHQPADEILGREGRDLVSLEEPRHLVHDREHPLGQVPGHDRHQGDGRRHQPLRPLARSRQGPRPRPICRRATAAASRPSSTARPSIRRTRPPISTASRSRRCLTDAGRRRAAGRAIPSTEAEPHVPPSRQERRRRRRTPSSERPAASRAARRQADASASISARSRAGSRADGPAAAGGPRDHPRRLAGRLLRPGLRLPPPSEVWAQSKDLILDPFFVIRLAGHRPWPGAC